MPSFKTIALAVTLATTALAYTEDLEVRSDLDFAPEDLEILFGRSAEPEAEAEADFDYEDDLELIARDLDIDSEDLAYLITRDPGVLSAFKGVAKAAGKFGSKHKEGIKSTGRHAASAGNTAAGLYSQHQQVQMAQANAGMMGGGMTGMGMQGMNGMGRRSLADLDDDELAFLIARDPGVISGLKSAGRRVKGMFSSKNKGAAAQSAAGYGAEAYGQQPQNYRREAFEEEDPEMWY